MKQMLVYYIDLPQVKEKFYVVDLFLLLSIAYAFGTAAPWMPIYIGILTIIVVIISLTYYVIREKWYIFDWCYIVTVLDTVYILFFPRNYKLHLIYLCYANGLQVWSVLLLQNALVIHRPDKISNLFLHNLHSLVAYFIRVDTTGRYISLQLSRQVYYDYLIYGIGAYILWCVGFIIIQAILLSYFIKKKNLLTLIDYIKMTTPSIGTYLNKFSEFNQNVIFLYWHVALFLPSTLLSLLSLYSLKFHMLICLVSLYSVIAAGSHYYTTVMKDSTKSD